MEDVQILRTQYIYWREFLLRSKKYEMVCDAIRETKERVGWPEQFNNWVSSNGELNYGYINWAMDNKVNAIIKHRFKQERIQFSADLTLRIYPLFQDIFQSDFEAVWNRVQIYYTSTSHPKTVSDGVGFIADLFEAVERGLTATLQREPSLREIKEGYFSELRHLDKSRRIFSVASFGYTKNKVVSDFRDELSKIFKRVGADKPNRLSHFPCSIYEPTGSVSPKHFDMYLAAFDAKKNAPSTREALRSMYPELDRDTSANFDECERSFRRHCAKANQLIRNAEIANFPGKISNS